MTTITLPISGFLCQDTDDKSYHFHLYEPSLSWRVIVCPVATEIQVEIPPDYDITAAQIKNLSGQLETITSEYIKKCAELKGAIRDLQAIAYQPAAAEVSDDIPF